ncbi:MAG: hypothetical protein QXL67_00095, partial [Candidatus Bathyarchaeia archaeon]
MSVLEGFRFRSSNSAVHRLDPRVKFLYVCIVFLIAVIYTDLVIHILLFFFQFPVMLLGKVYKQWLK